MRILQFMASEKWGGAEKVFVEVSNELAKTHQIVALVLRHTEYLDQFTNEVKVVELKSNPTRNNPLLTWEISQKVREIHPDIIHTHAAKAAALLRNVSFFYPLKHLATKHNARKGKVFNHLPWVTAVSEEAAHSVHSRCKANVKVINNGINLTKPKKNCRLQPCFTITAIGRLDKIKCFHILIEQVKKLPFSFHLSIVGEGQEQTHLEEIILSHGLEECISLPGFCNDIPTLMKQTDLVVISSDSEGFPKVMVEALFYGKVLISTPVGGVREVLPSFFLAEQAQLANKIIEVRNNYSQYAARFAELKELKADAFLLPKIIARYEAVYHEMLDSVDD